MKFSFSWLKSHLETSASLKEIENTLTTIGLEVENLTNPAESLKPFRIAKVLNAEQHPNADRLKVLTVDSGDGSPIQVICGAPNARIGLLGVLALPGDYIPGISTKLSVGKIRGVESHGMLCSERELELSDEHEGIIDLPEDAPIGASFIEYSEMDDPVFEIGLTPNRPDCTGVRGIARDLAAAGLGALKDEQPIAIKGTFPCPVSVTLDFGETDSLCPAFALRLIKGVKNGSSPKWLQNRLTSIGLRPINTLVDITNFVTFDRGRPLHVFDAAKISGNLVVRRGKKNEKLLALDGKEYEVNSEMCVISDKNGVESLSGIMGGEHSGCSDKTVDVLVESALWEPFNVAQTGRKLGINSDARYRFERGVDPLFMIPGLELATKLIIDNCGGEPSDLTVAGNISVAENVVEFPFSEIKRLTGLDILPTESKEILTGLGFEVGGSTDEVKVKIPSWRPDVKGKADLVEEVMRISGVDAIPATPLPRSNVIGQKVLTGEQIRRNKVRRSLATLGFSEAITWSFISKEMASYFGGGTQQLSLANPISKELSDMRPSLIPGLLSASQRNADRGYGDVALFEVGQVFASDEPEGQLMTACGLRRGTALLTGAGRHWNGKNSGVSVFDIKSDVVSILDTIGVPVGKLQIARDAPHWFHPGRSGSLKLGPKNILAHFGELHPKILREMNIKSEIAVFEIFLQNLPVFRSKGVRNKGKLNISELMSVNRDFAFVLDRSVEVAKLVDAAKKADKNFISNVVVFDVYEGSGIESNKKSVAIDVTIQPIDKTLTDEEIEEISGRIVSEVEKVTNGKLRKN